MTGDELGAGLARLLREGLVIFLPADGEPPDDVDRFSLTPRGRAYVEETDDDDQEARCLGVEHAESETTQRRVG